MNCLNIPTEVFGGIFPHLRKPNILQCALVCKSWNGPALQFMYKDLSLDAYHVYLAKKQLKLRANERNDYFKYGALVKKLAINCDDQHTLKFRHPKGVNVDSIQDTDCEFDKDDLILLLEYLPNLQNLDVGSSDHVNKYFQYILDTDSNKCLNKMQVISPAKRDFLSYYPSNSIDTHFSICYKYRTSITTLVVNYEHIMIDLGSQQDRMITFLSHFTSLIDLTLNNICDAHLTTFDIERICPHLVSLKYNSSCDIPDGIVENILNNSIESELKSNLKVLELRVPTVPVNYARYIAEYVSPQADVVKLSIDEVDLYDWIDDIGMDNALKLVSSLSTVKNATISCQPDKEYERKSSNDESNVTTFFKLLHAFKGNKKTYCHGHYGDFRRVHNSMRFTLNGRLRFNYGLDYADYYLRNEQDSEQDSDQGSDIEQEHQLPRVVKIALPDTASSIIGPEVINHMDIIMCDSNPELSFKFLEYALVHCPNLQCFEFKSMNRPHQDICISTDINYYKERGDHHIISKSTQKNLKVIETANFIPSNELLNLISTHLPNIETLACGNKSYDTMVPKVNEMDLKGFKNLKMFHFDILILAGRKTDHAFIHFQYSDGDEAYYDQNVNDERTLNPTTAEFVQECNNNENIISRSITIKCSKDMKFIVYCQHLVIAEFANGERLDHTSIRSSIFDSPFVM